MIDTGYESDSSSSAFSEVAQQSEHSSPTSAIEVTTPATEATEALPTTTADASSSIAAMTNETIFAEDGDLTVIVGASTNTHAFQVHRQILRIASPKWRLLTIALHSTEAQLHLPEDSPTAFAIAMKAAHYLTSEIPATVDRATLFAILDLYDKYDLSRLLASVLNKWMERMEFESVEVELKVFWLLRDKDEFEAAWKRAVLHAVCKEGRGGEHVYREVERKTEFRATGAKKGGRGVCMETEILPKVILSKSSSRDAKIGAPRTRGEDELTCDNEAELTLARKRKLDDLSTLMPTLLSTLSTKSFCKPPSCQQNAFHCAFWLARKNGVLDTKFPPSIVGALMFDAQNTTVEEAANWLRDELDLGGYRCKRRCLAAQYRLIDEACDDIELPEVLAGHFEAPKAEEQPSKRIKLET